MTTTYTSQDQLNLAFTAGREAAASSPNQIDNPYADRGNAMPAQITARGALWLAFAAGIMREHGNIKGAGAMLHNARYWFGRATELGRA